MLPKAEFEKGGHQYAHRRVPLTTRAARLLGFGHAYAPQSTSSNNGNSRALSNGNDPVISEKSGLDTIAESGDQPDSSLLKGKASLTSDPSSDNLDRRRYVRTLPPWIHSLQQDESLQVSQQVAGLLSEPTNVKIPQRNHTPSSKPEPKAQAARGRAWDHARSAEAITMSYPSSDLGSRWQEFIGSSAYARPRSEEGDVVSDEWVKENIPDLNEPWKSSMVPTSDKDERMWLLSDEKRTATFRYFQGILMKNPFVPLVIRVTVMTFCLAALGLGVQIWRKSESLNHVKSNSLNTKPVNANGDYICKQQASTYMAFIVDSLAVVYLLYITYDEYFSRPLGLRRSRDKMRLLFLDLLFIIFSAANLSLAFNTLTDQQWSCFEGQPSELNLNNAEAARSACVTSSYLCQRQKGLVSVLLIAEIAWVMTFSISTLRVVERVQR